MGASMSEEDYVTKLINLSNSTLSSELVYQIVMKSGCRLHSDKASELLVMYSRFQALDTNKKGLLSNSQFLQLEEFMYNPFKDRLRIAIPFRPEEYIMNKRHSVLPKQVLDDAPTAAQNTPNTDSRKAPGATSKIQPEETKAEEKNTPPPSEVDRIPYIDFEQFAVYLAVFCPRCPHDLKTNCNPYSVLMRLYDFDGDGQLGKSDIAGVLRLVIGQTMPEPEIEEVVSKVFKELSGGELTSIDKDSFQSVLWATDFLNKMTLHFD